MSDRNYDYLPADADALKDEIARLDRELIDAREECDERVRAAVAEEQARMEAVYRTALAVSEQKQEAFGEMCEEVAAAGRAAREACARLVESECDDVSGEEDDWRAIVAERIRSRL